MWKRFPSTVHNSIRWLLLASLMGILLAGSVLETHAQDPCEFDPFAPECGAPCEFDPFAPECDPCAFDPILCGPIESTLTGTVTNVATGLFISGISVEITGVNTGFVYTASTDTNGQYSFLVYDEDDFNVTFTDPNGVYESYAAPSSAPLYAGAYETVNAALTPLVVVNNAPVAVDDSIKALSTLSRMTVVTSVPAPGLLANDTDPDITDTLTVEGYTQPAYGDVFVGIDGSYVYTPTQWNIGDFQGTTDSFTYTVTDGTDSSVGQVNITVGVNTLSGYVTDVDTGLPIEGAIVRVFKGGLETTVTSSSSGEYNAYHYVENGTYMIQADGPEGSSYEAYETTIQFDEFGDSHTVHIALQAIAPINEAPIATDDSEMTLMNQVRSVYAPGLLGNDSDADGDALTAALDQDATNGTAVVNADGSYTYTPANGFAGVDSFTYIVSDGNGGEDTATVTIRVLVDSSADVNVPLDAGWNLFAYPIQQTRLVTLALSSIDGQYTSVFEYIASDTADPWRSYNAELPADFAFLNDLTALEFSHGYWINTTEATTIVFDGLTRGATMMMQANRTLNATPPATVYGYLDASVFSADMPVEARIGDTVCGQGVTHINADGQVLYGLDVISADTNPNCGTTGSEISIVVNDELAATATWGNSSATNTTNPNGFTSVALRSTEATTATIWQLVILTSSVLGLAILTLKRRHFLFIFVTLFAVAALANPMLVAADGIPPELPHTVYGFVTVDGEAAVDGLSVIIEVTSGEDSFTYPAVLTDDGKYGLELLADDPNTDDYDGGDDSSTIHFYVEVDGEQLDTGESLAFQSGMATSVDLAVETNSPPVANDDLGVSLDEDTSISIDVLANDTDPNNDDLTITNITVSPQNGVATIVGNQVVYSPTLNFAGADGLTYEISDGEYTDTAQVSITVNPVNDAPTIEAINESVDEDSQIDINVIAYSHDVDGDSLLIDLVGAAAEGTAIAIDSESIRYTPDPDINGSDSFTFTISDGSVIVEGTVNITINPLPDAPTAVDDEATINEDAPATLIEVLDDDFDVDGDPITLDAVSVGALGSAATSGSQISYTPNPNAHGVETLSYTISDDNGNSATGSLTITIVSVNDVPVAVNDSEIVVMNEDRIINAPGVLANDSDVESTDLTASIVEQGAKGTVLMNADGGFTYTPDVNAAGSDSFTYAVSDGEDSAEATVSILIIADSTSAEIIIEADGWNLFGYPIFGSTPIAIALQAIDGNYTRVFGYDGTDSEDPWRMYDPSGLLPSNLTELSFGRAYWILTEGITSISFGGTVDPAPSAGRAVQSATLPPPPMVVYGTIDAPDAAAGSRLVATVDGTTCGTTTIETNESGAFTYRLFINSASGSQPACGQADATITLALASGQQIDTITWSGSGEILEHALTIAPTQVGLVASSTNSPAPTHLLVLLVSFIGVALLTRFTIAKRS